MRLLFVHRSFPGQFGRLVRALAAAGGHQLVFVTQGGAVAAPPPGVTVVPFRFGGTSLRTHGAARGFDEAMRRAAAVAEVAAGLREAGFRPDVILGHEGWGDTLNLRDVYPEVPQIGFREYFYHESGSDVGCDPGFPVHRTQLAGVRARNAVPLLALLQGHAGVSPTRWQRDQYPAWARGGIRVVEDAVDLADRRPDPDARGRPFRLGTLELAPGGELLTFVASSLEPYRGLHTLLRALPELLRRRPRLQVACLGSTEVQYGAPAPDGTWRDWLLRELGDRLPPGRVHWPGIVPDAECGRLLRRSDVHAYLSYPFIVSWSLREALSCGCAVVAGDTEPVREFVRDGETGVLVPPFDPGETGRAIGALLDDPARRGALGAAARRWAEERLRPETHLAGWARVIGDVSGREPSL